jgi:hypothetical protein
VASLLVKNLVEVAGNVTGGGNPGIAADAWRPRQERRQVAAHAH